MVSTTQWDYDPQTGLLRSIRYADGTGPRFEYNADGTISKRIWARGVETRYSYDSAGHLSNIEYSDGTPARRFEYDRVGRMVSAIAEGVSTNRFEYDAASRIVAEWQDDFPVLVRYDTQGRFSGYRAGNIEIVVGHDQYGRIVSVSSPWAIQSISYAEGSKYPSVLDAGMFRRELVFDSSGGNVQAVHMISARNGTTNAVRMFVRTPYRGISSESWISETEQIRHTYSVDGRMQLVGQIVEVDGLNQVSRGWMYDNCGNRTKKVFDGGETLYETSELDQIVERQPDAESVYEFDTDGNQTVVQTGMGVWRIRYDGENRPSVWSNGVQIVKFRYDGTGRRIGVDGVFSTTIRYFGNDPILISTNGSLHTTICWNSDFWGKRLPWLIHANATNYCFDWYPGSSVVGLFDLEGNVVSSKNTDGFGEFLFESSPWPVLIGWNGEPENDLTGTYDFLYRQYNAVDGRWLSRDPWHIIPEMVVATAAPLSRQSGDFSWDDSPSYFPYAFLGNMPQSKTEVLGLKWTPSGCCNHSDSDEWALVGGAWRKLAPGECTGILTVSDFDDCDGMTCGGGFYAVYVSGDCRTPGCDSWPYKNRRWWPGAPADRKSPGDRGSKGGVLPPGYVFSPPNPCACKKYGE